MSTMIHKTCILLLLALAMSCTRSSEPELTIACTYCSNDQDPDVAELQPRGKCAYERDGRVFVGRSALAKLAFPETGMATVLADGRGWFFVRRDGSTIQTITYDNGPDYFAQGLARYVENNKIGFIDESGKIVIAAQYDFALPFSRGYSIVCNGCQKVEKGEHSSVRGGTWGCIDKLGTVALPLEHADSVIFARAETLTGG